jgi:amino acid adenylation domain-containing protein
MDHADAKESQFEPFPESALDGSIVDRFDAIVREYPSRLAVSDTTQSLTYSELWSLVDRIAVAVDMTVDGRPGPVAIFRPNDVLYAAATLGILAAGRAYVPMDADYPVERNQLIASHAGIAAVVAGGANLGDQVRNLVPRGVPIVDIAREVWSVPRLKLRRPGPNDIAHILYTSGSTGVPKGVYQNHRGSLHSILQRTNALHLSSGDRLVLFHSPSTIDGARVTLTALLNGASLHILPPTNWKLPALAREIRSRGITVCHSVPTVFRHLTKALKADERFDSIRVVHLSGECVDWADLRLLKRTCKLNADLVVALGSTESCASYVQWFVDEKVEQTSSQLPIGRDIADFRLTIVDEEGKPVPDGALGEITVSSRYIALGYWRDPQLTARVFSVDPADPEVRILKTGDLGRRRSDGLLEFLGRKDHQIKLSGNRIELTEIESAIRECESVCDAAVVVRRIDNGAPSALVGYITVLPGNRGLLPRHIQSILARRLPKYMVPSQILVLGDLPRLPNFKIDRSRLAELDAARPTNLYDRLNDPLIKSVAEIFKAVVGVSGVTANDTFASIGGDSLQAITVAAELERRYGVVIPDHFMKERLTIREITRWLQLQRAQPPQRLPKRYLRRATRHFWRIWDFAKFVSPPFEDDAERDVQIVARDQADCALLLFCNDGNNLGIPLADAHHWFGRLNASLVYLRDFQQCYFVRGVRSLGSTYNETLLELRRIVASLGAKRILCYGSSSGVFGALSYGLDLQAEAVLCLAGATNLSPVFNAFSPLEEKASALQAELPDCELDLAHRYAAAATRPRVRMVYGDSHWDDRLHAKSMGSLEGVTLQPLENVEDHNVMGEFARQPHQFERLLDWLGPPAPFMRGTRIWRFIMLGSKSVRWRILGPRPAPLA